MSKIMGDDARQRIVRFLPGALSAALKSYEGFLSGSESKGTEDAKTFKARHDACKVAIAHIVLILKLAETVQAEGAQDLDLADLIQNASDEIKYHETKNS